MLTKYEKEYIRTLLIDYRLFLIQKGNKRELVLERVLAFMDKNEESLRANLDILYGGREIAPQ